MLPILNVPHFTIKSKYLPGGKMTLRPFLVGQESIMLQAKDSEDKQVRIDAIKQIINECVVSPKGFDIGDHPVFLMELIFVRLREHSIGDNYTQQFRCMAQREGEPCNQVIDVPIQLSEVDLVADDSHKNTFMLSDDIGIKMKYATVDAITEMVDIKGDATPFDEFKQSLDCIFHGDEVFDAKSAPDDELRRFYNSMTFAQKAEVVKSFTQGAPAVRVARDITCPSCGKEHHIEIRGIDQLFG